MLLYALVSLVLDSRVRIVALITVIVCGIVYFNTYYLSYQQDYYRQLGFQHQLELHKTELEDAANIIYINTDSGLMNQQSFYALNGNAAIVFENQKRFILPGFNVTSMYLTEEENKMVDYFVESGAYHMSDYDRNHKSVDAIIEYSFDTDLYDTLKMKMYELTGNDKFESWIENRTSMTVYHAGTDEFDNVLEKYGYEDVSWANRKLNESRT